MIRINLAKAGETTGISKEEQKAGVIFGAKWTSKNDLDLHAFVEYKDGTKQHVSYARPTDNKGNISLDKDAGVGGRVAAGGNDETIRVKSLDNVKRLALAINDFEGGNLKNTKPEIKIELNGKVIDVVLAEVPGSGEWLTLIYITEDGYGGHGITNLSDFSNKQPSLTDIERRKNIESGIDKTLDATAAAGKTLFGKVKGFFKR